MIHFNIHCEKSLVNLLTAQLRHHLSKEVTVFCILRDKRLRRVQFSLLLFAHLDGCNKGHFCHEQRQCDIGKCLREIR